MATRKKKDFITLLFGFIQSKCFFWIMIFFAFFVRVFNLHRFLGFYFDQGRDALTIWNFIKSHKLFLIGPTIGPTMGVGDVPRGPWYLWILTPFYWLGQGNPVFPAWFLVFSVVLGVGILYFLCFRFGVKYLPLLFLIVSSFSFSLVLSSHWLSNPTFMYLLSALFLVYLFGVADGKDKFFWLSGLVAGISFHFGSAADMFYPVIVLIVAYIYSRKLINFRNLFIFTFLYAFSFLPQFIFDIRHDGVIRKGLWQFLVSNRSFALSFWQVLESRLSLYLKTFSEVVWGKENLWFIIFFLLLLFFSFLSSREIWKNKYFVSVLISSFIPLVGMLFLRGEKGVIYGYYFTGYYLYFVIFFSFLLLQLLKLKNGYLILVLFVFLFLGRNFYLLSKYFSSDFRKYNPVTLEDQLKAVDWIYQDANGNDFNVDFYVPPVIPYAYEYIFKWRGSVFFGKEPSYSLVNVLYTIQEPDNLHPDRVNIWRERQNSLSKVEQSLNFGPLLVEKRARL